jgi:serine/threonine protein kinase
MELSVQNVYGLLIRSRLMPLEEAKAMFQRWQGEARQAATNLELFTKWLVAKKYLTDYQVTLLVRGHADGFFLNQYKILDRLGKGRMAGVYKAVHSLGQVVAIKVLPPSKAKDPQTLGRFQREAHLALRLKHPNIVRSFQVGEADGVRYLVMEYLEGETLDEVLQRRGRLPPPEAARLIHQALLGLQHIHEQGLVHRDLKPANLMLVPSPSSLTPTGERGEGDTTMQSTVKILDIGLGRIFDENSPLPAGAPRLTDEDMLLGTPDYLAPEQARDAHAADIRADIYSLGCVLYHTLTGQPPFPDSSVISQMVRHATETPRPLKAFNPTIPDGLQQILNWMLAKEPAQRYPTPERAAQALQVFLAAGLETEAEPEAHPPMRSYLSWLESEEDQAPPAAAPAEPLPEESPNSSAGKRRSKKGKRPRQKTAITTPAPVKTTVTAAVSDKDIELGLPAVVLPEKSGAPAAGPWLSRRDLLLFALGAGSVLFAIFVGWLLAWLKKEKPAPTVGETGAENR